MTNSDIRDIVMEIQRNQLEMMNLLYELKNEVTLISNGGDRKVHSSKKLIKSESPILPKSLKGNSASIFLKKHKKNHRIIFNGFDSKDEDLLETFNVSSTDDESESNDDAVSDIVDVIYVINLFLGRSYMT